MNEAVTMSAKLTKLAIVAGSYLVGLVALLWLIGYLSVVALSISAICLLAAHITAGVAALREISDPRVDYPVLSFRRLDTSSLEAETRLLPYYVGKDGHEYLCNPSFAVGFSRWLRGRRQPVIVYSQKPSITHREVLMVDEHSLLTERGFFVTEYQLNGGPEEATELKLELDEIHSLSMEQARVHVSSMSTWASEAAKYARENSSLREDKTKLLMGIEALALQYAQRMANWDDQIESELTGQSLEGMTPSDLKSKLQLSSVIGDGEHRNGETQEAQS